MADFDITQITSVQEALEKLKEEIENGKSLEQLQSQIDAVAKSFSLNSGALQSFTENLKTYANGIDRVARVTETATKLTSKFGEMFLGIKARIGDANLSTGAFVSKLLAISPAMMAFTNVPKQFDAIGEAAKGQQIRLAELMEKSPKAAEMMTQALQKIGLDKLGFGADDIKKYATYMDSVNSMQRGMIMTAAASGTLNQMMEKAGDQLQNLDAATNDYNKTLVAAANATGTDIYTLGKYADSLQKIPGMMKSVSDTTSVGGQKMQMLTAAMTVATGTGQDFDTVIKDLDYASENFNLTGEKALNFINRMASAAQTTGIPLEKMKDLVEKSAANFQLLGDNTDGAINIIGKLAPALKDLGTSPDQINNILKSMTDGIQGMTTAQKSFLSSSTGGPGGLQGAFKIDQMIADRKIDQVFEKVRANMIKRLGGPIVTRVQASMDPVAAAQYQKQLMFMQSPAMGGLAKDAASADRLLQAMTSKKSLELPTGFAGSSDKEKNAAMIATLQLGHRLQDRANTKLNEIANNTARFAGEQAIHEAAVGRNIIGNESEIGQQSIFESRKEDAGLAGVNPFFKGKKGNRTVEEDLELISKNDEGEVDTVKALTNTAAKIIPRGLIPSFGQETAPVDSNKRIANTINKGQRAMPQVAGPMGAAAKSGAVQVSVHTLCEKCNRNIAKEEANAAIHNHDKNTRSSAYTGQQSD